MPDDLDAWKTSEPTPGFADRVVAAARREPGRATPSRRARVLSGVCVAIAASMAALFFYPRRAPPARGDAVAEARREVQVGPRAVAVLEPGAYVRWDGAEIEQQAGDVFWRVSPGGPLVVKTPGGEVRVKGTCFRVKVLAGAIAGAAIVVAVYEGKVVVAREGRTREVSPGETVEATAAGVTALPGDRREDPGASGSAAEHAVATLDRARADHMREEIRALLAKTGPAWSPPDPAASASASAAPRFPTMPLLPGDASDSVDPAYLQKVVRGDFFPLARQCYDAASVKNPALAGTIVLKFKILGDPSIGGVVSEAKLGDKTTIDDPGMQTCMTESMMAVTFAAPPHGGEISVTYPIVFSPEDPDGG